MCIIFYMNLGTREQVKMLLASRCMTIKELARQLSEKSGKYYSATNLSARLKRGSLTYNEIVTICEILQYKIEFKSLV